MAQALKWAAPRLRDEVVLVHATTEPAAVRVVQKRLGAAAAGALVERALGQIARGLIQRGVGQLVVAGGETSGACVQALDVARLRIGPQIAPGAPWCHAASPLVDGGLHLALKSGNFGEPDFFRGAFEALRSQAARAARSSAP